MDFGFRHFIGRQLLAVFLLCCGSFVVLYGQGVALGEWRSHLPYAKVFEVTDGGDHVFARGEIYHFSFDKTNGYVQRYDKVWGLSDVSEAHIAYNPFNQALLITYENANIDLVKDGMVINLADIERKSVGGSKSINHIYFSDSLAYLSTSFGVVLLDMDREEFSDTYIIGDNGDQIGVYGVTIFNDTIFAATDEGIKTAPLSGVLLANYQNWTLQDTATGLPAIQFDGIVQFNNGVYARKGNQIYKYTTGNGWSRIYNQTGWNIVSMRSSNSYLVLAEEDTSGVGARVTLFNNNDDISFRNDTKFAYVSDALIDGDGVLWVADAAYGLVRKEGGAAATSIQPNGPATSGVAGLSVRSGEVWLAPGGAVSTFSYMVNGTWYNKNQYSDPALQDFYYVNDIYAVPNSDISYIGSYWDGLLKYENGTLTKFNKDNSSLQGRVGDEQRTYVSGFAMDQDGYLWVSNYGAPSPLSVLRPDGNWQSFTPPTPISGGTVTDIVIDDIGNKWIALDGSANQGFLVFNYGTDIDSDNDDLYKVLTSANGNGAMHNTEVLCVAKDNDGEIWFGTPEGIGVFYCASSIFSDQGCDAQRILVERDGFAGYLLETERVQCIAVDGANRKWVGTTNGLWLFSSDGTEEIDFFDADNSPLLSSNIVSLAIDGESGEVYVGTDKGLMSYRGEATAATDKHEDQIIAFPNPVRENYTGPIAIKGLAENAEVKITDNNGILIYQTTALGGQAIWDGNDYTGRRAKTGVYLIFSINQDGSDSKVGKLLFIK